MQSNHQHQHTNTVFSSWISFLSINQLHQHCQSTAWWSLCTPLCAKIVLGEKVLNLCCCVRSNHIASVVVKNFFRSRDQSRDLGHQVSRPRRNYLLTYLLTYSVTLCNIDCNLSSSGWLTYDVIIMTDVLFHNICTSHMIVTVNYDLCSVRSIFIIQPLSLLTKWHVSV